MFFISNLYQMCLNNFFEYSVILLYTVVLDKLSSSAIFFIWDSVKKASCYCITCLFISYPLLYLFFPEFSRIFVKYVFILFHIFYLIAQRQTAAQKILISIIIIFNLFSRIYALHICRLWAIYGICAILLIIFI